jgi:hypothetical protein
MQIRRPKAETRRKAETRKPNIDCVNKLLPCWDRLLIRMSDFGFPSGFGLRISDLARQLLRDNGIHGFFAGRRLGTLFTLARLARPDVEAAMGPRGDLPRAPNPLALPEAAIENIVRAQIALGPVTLAAGSVVTAFDEEPANVINTIASHVAARECKQEVHPMPVPRAIIVEPRPRPRRK